MIHGIPRVGSQGGNRFSAIDNAATADSKDPFRLDLSRQLGSLPHLLDRGFSGDLEPCDLHPDAGQVKEARLGALKGSAHNHQAPSSPRPDQVWELRQRSGSKQDSVGAAEIETHRIISNDIDESKREVR